MVGLPRAVDAPDLVTVADDRLTFVGYATTAVSESLLAVAPFFGIVAVTQVVSLVLLAACLRGRPEQPA